MDKQNELIRFVSITKEPIEVNKHQRDEGTVVGSGVLRPLHCDY